MSEGMNKCEDCGHTWSSNCGYCSVCGGLSERPEPEPVDDPRPR